MTPRLIAFPVGRRYVLKSVSRETTDTKWTGRYLIEAACRALVVFLDDEGLRRVAMSRLNTVSFSELALILVGQT